MTFVVLLSSFILFHFHSYSFTSHRNSNSFSFLSSGLLCKNKNVILLGYFSIAQCSLWGEGGALLSVQFREV